ncbi:MAG: pentapeptide repeat-containing protein [Anaerolineae bacterium]|nr:pentapeptide repeat-containing protein [Anaerolineae bacterium]MDL1915890.1 pentapeptide repeat-containing protein [Anaerolineae bacterium CFX4]
MTMKDRGLRTRVTRMFQRRAGNELTYLVMGVALGIIISRIGDLISDQPRSFFESLVPEFIGIVFTVFVINRLDAVREDRLILEKLLREMHSRYNPVSLQAIEELRVMGYLDSGVLRDRDFRGSSWQEANLYRADLRGADLKHADLENADLYEANLEGSTVTPDQLRLCKTLRRCIMPDGSRYDGRYNLHWDLYLMRRDGFNPDDPASAASFYEVPLETYQAGQLAEKR